MLVRMAVLLVCALMLPAAHAQTAPTLDDINRMRRASDPAFDRDGPR